MLSAKLIGICYGSHRKLNLGGFLEEGAPERSPEGAKGVYQAKEREALRAEGLSLRAAGPGEHLQAARRDQARAGATRAQLGGTSPGTHLGVMVLIRMPMKRFFQSGNRT